MQKGQLVNTMLSDTISPAVARAARWGPLRWLWPASGLLASTAAAGFAYAYLVEPMLVQLERLTVHLPQAVGRIPAEGLRILHLTDSHFRGRAGRERVKLARVRRLTRGLEYDLLVHTGDLIHYDSGVDNALALLDAVPPPRLGTYAVLGNHDYAHYAMQQALPRMWRTHCANEKAAGKTKWNAPGRVARFVRYVRRTPLDGPRIGGNDTDALLCALEKRGVQVLHNRSVHLCCAHRPGLDLYLAGVEDVSEGRPHLGRTLDAVPADAPVILLSHNPDILDSPQIGRVDLMLSGHTHGGQIVLPLWGPAHTQSWHLTRSEVSGFFRRGRTQVYVSRGLGEGIPLRFGAPPQIALITVLPE
jgi:predicted MPP superfamily phosphohydrolase